MHNLTPRYFFKNIKHICPHEDLYMDVYSCIIHYSQNWKWPKCSSKGEWISKLKHIHAIECYSAIKKWLICTTAWVYLKTLCQLKEVRHKRLHSIWFPLYNILEKGKYKDRRQISCCLCPEAGEECWPRGIKECFIVIEIVYTVIYIVIVLTLPSRVAKTHQMKHLKFVNFNNADWKCIYSSIHPQTYWNRILRRWSLGTDVFMVYDIDRQAADEQLSHQTPIPQSARNSSSLLRDDWTNLPHA